MIPSCDWRQIHSLPIADPNAAAPSNNKAIYSSCLDHGAVPKLWPIATRIEFAL